MEFDGIKFNIISNFYGSLALFVSKTLLMVWYFILKSDIS